MIFVVRKYKATKEEGLGEKFSKLSMHSTRKKIARLSQKMVGPFVSTKLYSQTLINSTVQYCRESSSASMVDVGAGSWLLFELFTIS